TLLFADLGREELVEANRHLVAAQVELHVFGLFMDRLDKPLSELIQDLDYSKAEIVKKQEVYKTSLKRLEDADKTQDDLVSIILSFWDASIDLAGSASYYINLLQKLDDVESRELKINVKDIQIIPEQIQRHIDNKKNNMLNFRWNIEKRSY